MTGKNQDIWHPKLILWDNRTKPFTPHTTWTVWRKPGQMRPLNRACRVQLQTLPTDRPSAEHKFLDTYNL